MLLYGGRVRPAPEYEFARLPRGALALDRTRRGRLGPPELNPAYEPVRVSRSWVKRHPVVVETALALAAATVQKAMTARVNDARHMALF